VPSEASASVETSVPILNDGDVVKARQMGRELASQLGFSSTELTLIATAISELARNVVIYAGTGEILLQLVNDGERRGLVVVARDKGPGIADLDLALKDGYSTGEGMGLGLPGARRLMDDFAIESEPGHGTVVTTKKWARGG
jgi:serine/threonine-protein kinase RsbT